jgi:hypothetical protein
MSIDLEVVAAKLEIQELVHRYAWAADTGDLDSLADVFSLDATLETSTGTTVGSEAIQDGFREFYRSSGWTNLRHNVSNIVIDVRGDKARSKAYAPWTHVSEGTSWLGWANYYSRHEQRAGRWWTTYMHIAAAGPVTLEEGWAGVDSPNAPKDWTVMP